MHRTLDGEVQEKWSIKNKSWMKNYVSWSNRIHRASFENTWAWCFWIPRNWNGFTKIDREKVQLSVAYNLNWKTLQPVKEKIEIALHIPFFIDNDANVAAGWKTLEGASENQPECRIHDTWYRCRRWVSSLRSSLMNCTWSCWWAVHRSWLMIQSK